MEVLANLEPREVFRYFEEICSIPHGSYHEEQISSYCVKFAKDHGLEVYQDDLYNVIIIKEATPGYEQEPPLMLQGHLDMVCEKEADCRIDFEKDGLELMIEGDYITANGTTLGGDDGIAVAYALAILDSETIQHPKLEVVLTVSEEVGMEGAAGIDVSMLESRRLLNLDSEEEGIMLVGCAGGVRVDCSLPIRKIDSDGTAVKLEVSGLKGGHSGTEINKGRGNAIILMGRILISLSRELDFAVAELEGGGKDNAIPRKCSAILCFEKGQEVAKMKQKMLKIQEDISKEYEVTDPDVRITAELTELPSQMLDEADTRRVIQFMNMLPNGIQAMSADVENLVETSLNLGILKLDSDSIKLRYSVRSSVGSAKEALLEKLVFLTEGLGGAAEVSGEYPAWEYKRDSALREKLIAIYERIYGKKPKIEAIHAGVECGFLTGKLPGLDCISMGPNIEAIHTPEEKLSISSTKRVWEYLLEVLKTKEN